MGGKGSGNRTKSNPFTAKKADAVDPDTNARTIMFTLALGNLPDFDHGSVEETMERVNEFFQLCVDHGMRPLVGAFCVAMGMSKAEMWQLVNGQRSGSVIGVTPTTLQIYKKVLCLIDTNFEQVLMDVKNPVPAIFYAKSNLGWNDAHQEITVTHKNETPQMQGGTVEEIAKRYIDITGVDAGDATLELPKGE